MSFKLLIGQQDLRSLLLRTLDDGKISHAVLLTGPPGSGKKSWGKALSMAILCPHCDRGEPCMKCFSCRSFLNNNHSSYFELSPDGKNIKIEQIRSIRENFYLQGSKKVCMIDQAEAMTAEASSSLLKILEDPPPDLYFILLARQPRLLFDTILSRCQRYVVRPLKSSQLTNLLLEHKDISTENAVLITRISGGLPGYAFKLAEDKDFERRFKEAKTLSYNLATGCDSAFQLLAWALYLSEKEELTNFLEFLCMFYRDGLVQKLCSGESAAWLKNVDSACLEDAVLLINNVIYEINTTNVNSRLLLEKMLILLQRRLARCQKSSECVLSRPEKPTTLNLV